MNLKKVKISDLRKGPIKRQSLPDDFVERVKRFKEVLKEVETSSLEDTLDGFKRDQNPEKELKIWEGIASAYQWAIVGFVGLNRAEKKDVFAVLLGCSMGMEDFSDIKNLSKEQVETLIKFYSSEI